MPEFRARPTLQAQKLRNEATPAERKLWTHVSRRQVAGIKFSRQIPIGPYICDFVSRSAKLVIEVDGGQHDWNAGRDQARTAYIENMGYRVIRFWNNDVLERTEGVVSEIERALQSMPSPNPVPGEQRPALFRSCRGHDRPGTRKREGSW